MGPHLLKSFYKADQSVVVLSMSTGCIDSNGASPDRFSAVFSRESPSGTRGHVTPTPPRVLLKGEREFSWHRRPARATTASSFRAQQPGDPPPLYARKHQDPGLHLLSRSPPLPSLVPPASVRRLPRLSRPAYEGAEELHVTRPTRYAPQSRRRPASATRGNTHRNGSFK
ncbi:hypothetical protein HPB52_019905 [Rhipicephalus sanguineus]|uniref:Uncharacterized protein n=1 Tax=Rhipicephalus sanguineus TaxID=34632 RepID=A0A9D4SR95_RHISA|nr:hypothetical protein HPB52_019905 [Rhipicephalus sanguineus]